MKRSAGSRKTANLSESVRQHLNSYALAAGAAGVGALALSSTAEAKIVYHHVHYLIAVNSTYHLDLNHDGIVDFTISNVGSCSDNICGDTLNAVPSPGNGVAGIHASAYALKHGVSIGPKRPLLGKLMAACGGVNFSCSDFTGQWLNVTNRYLGLKFRVRGKTHYGWARLTVTVDKVNVVVAGTLTGYAYETTANKPIIAGKTAEPDADSSMAPSSPISLNQDAPESATLGRLAVGAPGVSVWRRKRQR
jgi:hypothetical protein